MTEERLVDRITEYAYRLLSAKPRSETELRDRLIQKQWADTETMLDAVEQVISRLKDLRYIDDGLFAYNFVKSRVTVRPLGKARVARDLARRKVSGETADEALNLVFDDATQESLIDKAIERRLRLKGKPESRQDTKKLFDHLMRLGFSYDLISAKLRGLKKDALDENTP